MMKNIFFPLILLCFFSGLAQDKQFKIDWKASKEITTLSKKYTVPYFTGGYFVYENNQIVFNARWEENNYSTNTSVAIKNIVTENINSSEIYDVPYEALPEAIFFKGAINKARNVTYTSIKLFPLYKDENQIKRVVSFDIEYVIDSRVNKFSNTNGRGNIINSVLREGTWYKFYVEKTGVYRIDRNFLRQLGVDINTIDPRKIKIYGNGGRMQSLMNEVDYIKDTPENAIQVIGEADGSFDANDYILFYAIGPDEWNEESQTYRNVYTDLPSYFLSIGETNGKRILDANQPNTTATTTITKVDMSVFHEQDITNIAKVGRRWFGEQFNIENEQIFEFTIPDIDISSPIRVGVKPAAVSSSPSSMSVNLNGQEILGFNFTATPQGDIFFGTQDNFSPDGSTLKRGLKYADATVSGQDIEIALVYNNNGNPSAIGYLDYIAVEAKRHLSGKGGQYTFTYKNSENTTGVANYVVSDAANISQIWEVTDNNNIVTYRNLDTSTIFEYKTFLGENHYYAIVNEEDFYEPVIIASNQQVPNQNVKGTIFNDNGQPTDIDYIIIAPQFLLSQAQRLADFHRTNSGLIVRVVSIESIYNEFNSGNPDIAAIRNFIRYIYDNASNPANRLKYVALFGDASIDYKDRLSPNTNIVPIFHSYESFSFTFGIASDDFYTMMDVGEGHITGNDLMDIAIGRILANTPQEADAMVDKIIAYHQTEALGRWRNSITLLADDVDDNWEGIIQSNLNDLGDRITINKPFFNLTKIYADAFKQEVSSGGERYPKAKEELLAAIDLGTLVVNYFGHGGEEGLAQERLFTKADAESLRNNTQFPLFITTTCEFTRFDNPERLTAGELTFWNEQGGAIGLITTTREIFVGNGIAYNDIISDYLFPSGTENYSVAEILRRSKVDPRFTGGVQKRVVFFIGDPAIKLAIPKPNVNLLEINDIPITQPVDTLKALSKIKMRGVITDENNNILTNYNGTVFATIHDKNTQKMTLANDQTRDNSGALIFLDFETLGESIFRGKATAVNGEFTFNFVVPRDISIPVGKGRVSFYSERGAIFEDKAGYNLDINVGGINENAPEDNIGPEIQLFMNNESFVSGGITNESPLLIAILKDENGINTASGIGHDIVAILDGDENNPFVLNDYYEAEIDDFTEGRVSFPFRDLDPGLHTLTLKAWDVYNNSSTAEIQFLVLDDGEIQLERVLNYPNPFTSYTEFWFQHNKPFEPIEVDIQVFTISGKVVWNTHQIITTDGFSRDIVWDGRDNFGDRIGKGVYVYKITVKSSLTNKKTHKFEKLVIL
ncbi:type IX secretion system sortase PorU [Leptobacterium sp. I13]|uniref:type IX secretion system sortase PorU n=1 Tax=Leptobacterium meishanense TaxID=3128904 RepID=UPI0030ED1D66